MRQISASPDFWNDNTAASALLKKISIIEKEIEDLELKMILGDEQDTQNAIMTIHPGAGGTESQDWAEMLYRMYSRWIERKGFKKEIMDLQPGDEAGIKDLTMEVKGDYAYGLLKAEAGVHRLVRISPFDSNSRRHTSFVSVFIYPSSEEEIEIDSYSINDCKKSRKKKQKPITHIPSGIVVQCQNERSQHKNKASAMKVLKARMYQAEVEKEKEAMKDLEDTKMDIGWGSQIRSYVFHPYNMVKDHRTKEESGNVSAVMDGDIDKFIRAFLMSQLGRNLETEKV